MKPVMHYVCTALPAFLILLANSRKSQQVFGSPQGTEDLNIEKILNYSIILLQFLQSDCQEFSKRGFDVQWVTVGGRNVGCQAPAARVVQIAWIVFKFLCQVNRERVFLLAVKTGCMSKVFQDLIAITFIKCKWCSNTFCKTFFYIFSREIFLIVCQWKEMKPLSEKMMAQRCQQTWNSLGHVPMHQWLVEKWSEGDRQRLDACGNLVMPQVASLALSILCGHSQTCQS